MTLDPSLRQSPATWAGAPGRAEVAFAILVTMQAHKSSAAPEKARELGIDLAATLEEALAAKLRKRQGEAWREENREAIAAYNEHVARNGVWSDGLRSF